MKSLKKIVTIMVLFFFGILLSLFWYRDVYITAIQELHKETLTNEFTEKPLLKEDTLNFEITAKHDNFGILKLRPKTFNRFNYDIIHFRLREKGTEIWSVNNAYVVDVFKDKLFYPLGFPVIPNSKGKTYEIEITSEKGSIIDSISFYGGHNSIATQYVYLRENIIFNNSLLTSFVIAKSISLMKDPYFVLFYLLFLLPILYFFTKSPRTRKRRYFIIEICIILYSYLVYIFLPVDFDSNVIIYVVSVTFLIATSYYYPVLKNLFVRHTFSSVSKNLFVRHKFSSSNIYLFAIILLLYLLINVALNRVLESTRLAIAVFYTIVLALGVSYIEFRNK